MDESISTPEKMLEEALAAGHGALSEHSSKRLLAAYGIPVVKEELVQDAAAAVAAATRIGYPVVVKACAHTLAHKSDRGLVRLPVDNPAEVEAAVADLGAAVGSDPIEGFLVQPMVRGRREVIAGGLRDRLFGPCVMFGLGGVLVEAMADVTFRLAPLNERDAAEMIGELRAQRVLGPVRGEPAVDRQALGRVLVTIGEILMANPSIAQVDVNPLIFTGAKPLAVDALITLAPQSTTPRA